VSSSSIGSITYILGQSAAAWPQSAALGIRSPSENRPERPERARHALLRSNRSYMFCPFRAIVLFDVITRGGALRFHRVAMPRAAFVLARWAISPSPRLPTDDLDIGGQATPTSVSKILSFFSLGIPWDSMGTHTNYQGGIPWIPWRHTQTIMLRFFSALS